LLVVDEGWMFAQYPSLMAMFADIARRGRKRGVNFVFATQRPHDEAAAIPCLYFADVGNFAPSIIACKLDRLIEAPSGCQGAGPPSLSVPCYPVYADRRVVLHVPPPCLRAITSGLHDA